MKELNLKSFILFYFKPQIYLFSQGRQTMGLVSINNFIYFILFVSRIWLWSKNWTQSERISRLNLNRPITQKNGKYAPASWSRGLMHAGLNSYYGIWNWSDSRQRWEFSTCVRDRCQPSIVRTLDSFWFIAVIRVLKANNGRKIWRADHTSSIN